MVVGPNAYLTCVHQCFKGCSGHDDDDDDDDGY